MKGGLKGEKELIWRISCVKNDIIGPKMLLKVWKSELTEQGSKDSKTRNMVNRTPQNGTGQKIARRKQRGARMQNKQPQAPQRLKCALIERISNSHMTVRTRVSVCRAQDFERKWRDYGHSPRWFENKSCSTILRLSHPLSLRFSLPLNCE